ncbi:MAG: hypothetical protein KDC45_01175 [Bacteroidetes bacterium]|nr:hypothetical protein [Bacteroidota bacterium]
MFEKIVDQVLATLQANISSEQGQWSYFEITRETSDETIRRIFQLRYEDIFQREAERLQTPPEGSMLPYESDAVKKSVARLVDDLKKNFMIPKSDIEKIMRDTLFTKLRYLVQPLATIESLLFEEATARKVSDIVAKFREFEKFRYYPDALERYAQAKAITHLTRGQLGLLITEINQSLFGDNLDNVLKLCGLIMKEINDIEGKTTSTIDTEILMKAFQDPSLRDYDVALNIEKELGSDRINIYGLRQVLNRFNILKQKKAVPLRVEKAAAAVRVQAASKKADTTKTVIEETLSEDSAEIIDIDKIIAEKPKKDSTDQLQARSADHQSKEPVKTPVIKSPSDVTGEFNKEDLTSGFSDDTAAIKLTDLKESDHLVLLQMLITPKDEKIIISTIFKTDGEAYNDFISLINRTKTWKEAIAILDDTLASLEFDPYSKEAIRLSDIVYARYYPPELAE